jgi:cell division protease FtsH
MSERIGQMAWGPRGPVFLGEELIHTRDYSDETARVIDQEVSVILGEQARRARDVLDQHRPALDGVAAALITHESLEGTEIECIIARVERPSDTTIPNEKMASGSR